MLPERAIAIFLFLCSFLSILITIGIVAVLLFEAITFFGDVSFIEFMPFPEEVHELVLDRFERGLTGSIFGGENPQKGTVEEILSANQ